MTLTNADKKRMTVEQRESLATERDCPFCSGTLERTEVRVNDSHVDEKYRHVGGDGSACPGHKRPAGWLSHGTWVEHYRDGKTFGAGALDGEFDG